MISYRKQAAAVKSYVLYTADRPASWDVLVDGVVRGAIVGSVAQYSRQRTFRAYLDGQQLLSCGYGRLKDAKRALESALARAVKIQEPIGGPVWDAPTGDLQPVKR